MVKSVLIIAGSDSGGGAGIQADIKTCCAFKVYASTAVTALTAQNTLGVQGIYPISPEFVGKQIRSVAEDIRPDAVKVGMLGTPEIAREVARTLKELELPNIIVDPVLVASCGDSLSGVVEETAKVIMEELAPLATLLTPNIPEACKLTETAEGFEDPAPFALRLMALSRAGGVLLKGGHADSDEARDYMVYKKGDELEFNEFSAPRVETPNNHGTGCTLSTAIACNLALGFSLEESVAKAKNFVTKALEGSRKNKIGKGTGPLDFFTEF